MIPLSLTIIAFLVTILAFVIAVLVELRSRTQEQKKEKLTKPHSERIDTGVTYFRKNKNEKITNDAWQKAVKVSDATATRDLEHLTELGVIEKKGRGRGVHYVFVKNSD